MDEHRPHTSDKPAKANGRGAAAAKPTSDRNAAKTHQRVVEKQVAQAKHVAGELIDHAKSAVGDALTSAAEDLGERAQEVARRTRDQAAATTKSAGDYLSRNAAARPLTALLVAGAVGYALASALTGRRRIAHPLHPTLHASDPMAEHQIQDQHDQ
jgi:ElaB/YqjD/DUF883 family membrane-anchored ribosome-binding protein